MMLSPCSAGTAAHPGGHVGAHDKVVQSWARRHDASLTHERKKDALHRTSLLVGRTGFEPVTSSVSGKISGILTCFSVPIQANLAAYMWLDMAG